METLIIGKPKIEKLDNRARLCSKISENGKPSYTLWFDVDAKYADYLTESADAFVVALLPYAMNNSLNISAEAKMSKQLCFQLNEIFIPVLTKKFKIIQQNFDICKRAYTGKLLLQKCVGNRIFERCGFI